MLDLTKLFPVAIPKGFSESSLEHILNHPLVQTASTQDVISQIFKSMDTIHIVQIGAGGTGGYVASNLLRQLGSMHPLLQDRIYYWLMDGDEFEAKNMGRQLCTEDDLGENKAEVLINKYGEFYGCNMDHVFAIPAYLTNISQLIAANAIPRYTPNPVAYTKSNINDLWHSTKYSCNFTPYVSKEDADNCKKIRDLLQLETVIPCHSSTYPTIIFIDCVDKNAPRKIIHDYMQQYKTSKSCYQSNSVFRNRLKNMLDFDDLPAAFTTFVNRGDAYKLISREMLSLRSCIGSNIYLISSGNSQYTGQVYWGRISQFFPDQPAATYSDIMTQGDPEDYSLANILTAMAEYNGSPVKDTGMRSLYENNRILEIVPNLTVRKWESIPDVITENPNYFKSLFMSVPTPYERFPELLDLEVDKAEEAMSCAERAAQNVQNITANQTAATLVNNYLTSILRGMLPMKDTDRTILTTAGINFNVNTNVFTSEYLTSDYLQLK
jgi:molybdopterin/thiamine biosynthesis adenylyltransferase